MKEKLSAIVINMAKTILKNPDKDPLDEAANVALFLATVAWGRLVACR